LERIAASSDNKVFIQKYSNDLASIKEPIRKDLLSTARKVLRMVVKENGKAELSELDYAYTAKIQPNFSSHLFSQSAQKASAIAEVLPTYDENAEEADGRVIIRDNFDAIFTKYPQALVFGEDAGNIGDVNQGLEGMQEKYGALRVDAGIREATIWAKVSGWRCVVCAQLPNPIP
jgi:hypothetical protein